MDTPDFGAIGTEAHTLFNLINQQMDTVQIEDPRWSELYDMFRLVTVVCSLASQACTRQAERDQADEPVPYTLADPVYLKRLEYLADCAPFESER